jgi:hypothetical protein
MRDRRSTPRTIRTSGACLVAAVGLLTAACSGLGDPIPSISLPPPAGSTGSTGSVISPATGDTGVTISPSGSGVPTSSPGITGTVSAGRAAVSLTGGVNASVTFPSLTTPAVWSPPPGAITLSWEGPGDQILSLGGSSFTSQIPTDASHTLAFTVTIDGAPIAFRSDAGECTVAISPALPTQMAGSFLCTDLASVDDAVSVNAQGTFSATG